MEKTTIKLAPEGDEDGGGGGGIREEVSTMMDAYFEFWRGRSDHIFEVYDEVREAGEYDPKRWVPDVIEFYNRAYDDAKAIWSACLTGGEDDDGGGGEDE